MTVDAIEMVQVIGDLAAPVTGTLSDAWQALVGDRVAAWRLENAAKLQEKVRQQLDRRNLTLNSARVPERYAFAWFEEATKQDEPEIQDLFAQLLARAAEGDNDAADRRHVESLSKFTPEDAAAFRTIMQAVVIRLNSGSAYIPSEFGFDTDDLMDKLVSAHGEGAWLSVEHLTSMGILARRQTVNVPSLGGILDRAGRTAMHGKEGPGKSTVAPDPRLQLDTQIWATRLGISLGRGLGILSA